MGAWGYRTFEDDTALDLIDEWMQAGEPHELLEQAIAQGLTTSDLDYDQGQSIAVAAAVLDFVLFPDRAERLEAQDNIDGLADWLNTLDAERLRGMAPAVIRLLDRLMDKNSELADLWGETEDASLWQNIHMQRQQRLAGA